jgi:hypothetical protein
MNSYPDSDPRRGTGAKRPDLDWSQVRETILMLELLTGQIMAAMRDSDSSVDVLAGTFTGMAGYVHTIVETARQLPNTPEIAGQKQALGNVAEQVETMVNQAVIAFQFYDKLVQRLSHVVNGLGEVSGIIADQRKLYNPVEWAGLQDRIRAKFSTAEERALFESVMSGTPIEKALEIYMASLHHASNEIELF